MPTSGMELTVLARLPQQLLERSVEAGLDPERLKHAAGLVDGDLIDPDARVPKSKMLALWQEICRCIDDPLLGLKLGSAYRARDMGLVGYIMAASQTLGLALLSLARYSRIIADDIQFTIHPRGKTIDLDISAPVDLIALEHPIVSRLSAMIAVMRDITKSELRPVAVQLPHSHPADPAPYRRFFLVTPQFASGTAMLTLRAEDLNLPVPAADVGLGHYLEIYAESVLKTLTPDDSLAHQIARILMVRLSAGDPGIHAIASTLGMNTRTVQRRLKEEGTNYRDVRDSFRRTTSCQLLSNLQVPIKEIAFLLGYQDLGAFYRAFRRWEHESPMDFRKKHAHA